MSDDPLARALDLLRELATTHDDPAVHELIRLLEQLGGDRITVGDITGSTAVAIGSDIRIAVKQYTLPPEVVERLIALADAMDQQAKETFHAAGHIRVFLSSPGDVLDERRLAMKAIAKLQNDPIYKEKITIVAVAWDKPDDSTPILASVDPQTAINEGLARPSVCDIVVVIMWARMGTPLDHSRYQKADGSQYLSGTEWEFEEAVNCAQQTGRPFVLVYRRTEEPKISLEDAELTEKVTQYRRVKSFFESFKNPDGSIRQGYNAYAAPSEFEDIFELHLRKLIARLIKEGQIRPDGYVNPDQVVLPTEWPAGVSPFPGLRAFGPEDAPVYFGRGAEADKLVKRFSDPECRFLAVVGASGSGKSSLVGAGLIPRLAEKAIPGSQDWPVICFTPDEWGEGDPFDSLAGALIAEPLRLEGRGLVRRLRESPQGLREVLEGALRSEREWAKALLFVDQFEELFTRIESDDLRRKFAAMLAEAAATDRIRTVITMRADFYHRVAELPQLAALLNAAENRTFPLSAPGLIDLYDMITGPAKVAGLQFESGLAQQILADTGDDPGALALLAYALQQLYEASHGTGGWLTWADYERIGGVQGAIGEQARDAFERLSAEAQAALPTVFRELVEVDERGTATRKRAPLEAVIGDNPACEELVTALTDARLLVTSGGEYPVVEVAHEALFRSWPRLVAWLTEARDDLVLLRQVRSAAALWAERGLSAAFLWPEERLNPVYEMIRRLQPELTSTEREFIRSEFDRLLEETHNPATTHQRRSAIGERLAAIGDRRPGVGLVTGTLPLRVRGGDEPMLSGMPAGSGTASPVEEVRLWGDKPEHEGLPDIVWLPVKGTPSYRLDTDEGEKGTYPVVDFYIAKYPITYVQFQAFINAEDGFASPRWWEGLAANEGYRRAPSEPRSRFDNYPRDSVSWWDAIAFCQWLNAWLGLPDLPTHLSPDMLGQYKGIRLPAEWEWQWAASGQGAGHEYPWEGEWDSSKANTSESGLSPTTAVGLYPAGAALCGALDVSGNVWEWCLNEDGNPEKTGLGGTAARVVRGGSWYSLQSLARAAYRRGGDPNVRDGAVGFRVVAGVRPLLMSHAQHGPDH